MHIVRKLKITELPLLTQLFNYKNVDEAYKNQLTAYREYIQSKTNKTVTTYLYSVFTGVLKEV